MSRLIIIRGNSGSGKTVTAKKLQKFLQPHHTESTKGTMLVSQDVIRREILRTQDTPNNPSIQMIRDISVYGRSIGYDVIVEGILSRVRYGTMLRELLEIFDETFVYYFDISLEETLRRHQTKPNAHEFGEEQMREWYIQRDTLGIAGEKIFTDNDTEEEIINFIIRDLN